MRSSFRWAACSLVGLVGVSFVAAAIGAQGPGVDTRPPNGKDQTPAFAGQTDAPEHKSNVAFDVATVAKA